MLSMSRYCQVFKALRPQVENFLTRCWIRTKQIRFKNHLKPLQGSIFAKNINRELNSNSLEGRKVLKLTTQLPNPEIIRNTIEKILRAFENIVQTELIRVRWEEIKNFKLQPIFT